MGERDRKKKLKKSKISKQTERTERMGDDGNIESQKVLTGKLPTKESAKVWVVTRLSGPQYVGKGF